MRKIARVCALVAVTVFTARPSVAGTVEATLNRLRVLIDADTGSVLRLAYDGPGTMLQETAARAGMIDLAYPIESFEPLRLASRYSREAHVAVSENSLTVSWKHLGTSRQMAVPGDVSAIVQWRAAEDGQSIILSAHVENDSKTAIRQVIFPDLAGLRPFLGPQNTLFRAGGAVSAPFVDLVAGEGAQSQQYMLNASAQSADYAPGGLASSMVSRWWDVGGLGGGMSFFPRRWGWQPQVAVRLHLSELDNTLRMMCLHDVTIAPGDHWDSGEIWLTPHQGGWARGIEPYRAWVKKNDVRPFPMPHHVKEGLGFRTVWMCQNQPSDPQDAVFTLKDLPKLAEDAKENGLDEMVLFAWNQGFVLPLPPPYRHLGSEADLVEAVAKCREIGVNVAPFISVLQANEQTAGRYGLRVVDNNGWTFHTELIPRWNPPYAHGFACVPVPINNPLWQKDVLAGATHLIDIGVTSLSWDQFMAQDIKPNINSLAEQIRAVARGKNPESTFSGEELYNFEVDSAQLDYTWDWIGQGDYRPLSSVFPAPRINACITSSATAVKQAFMDNRYINAFPRKKESINGSDYIGNWPAFSTALKQCAALRKQFLPYFVEGKLIGDCVLSKPAAGVRVCAYVMPDRVLLIALNQGAADPVRLSLNLSPWLTTPGRYHEMLFDAHGKAGATSVVDGVSEVTLPINAGELGIAEYRTE